MKNKGLVNGLFWLIGIVVFVKFMYNDISTIKLILGLLFILSIVWFVFSLFQIYYGLHFYISNQKWSYYSALEWCSYLFSLPLLIAAFILYVNFIK